MVVSFPMRIVVCDAMSLREQRCIYYPKTPTINNIFAVSDIFLAFADSTVTRLLNLSLFLFWIWVVFRFGRLINYFLYLLWAANFHLLCEILVYFQVIQCCLCFCFSVFTVMAKLWRHDDRRRCNPCQPFIICIYSCERCLCKYLLINLAFNNQFNSL